MVNLSTTAKNAACQAVTNLLSSGGKLAIFTATNVKLCEFVWTSAVFGSPSNGEAVANSVDPVEASAEGVASYWKLQDSDGVDVMWGNVGQRYKIVTYSGPNNYVTVNGDKTSEFAPRTLATLVYRTNPALNLVVRVDDAGSTYNGTVTTIPIFDDIPNSPTYNFIHVGLLGLDNVDIKEAQIIQLGSFRYKVLG